MKMDSMKVPASVSSISGASLGASQPTSLAQPNAVVQPSAGAPAVIGAQASQLEPSYESLDARGSLHRAYHEIASGHHVIETGALEQLRANIAQLEDLHGRLKFLMNEISGLVRKA